MRQIGSGELEVGSTLPWDVVDADRGHLVASERQLGALLRRGLVQAPEPQRSTAPPPSVLRLLNEAGAALHALLGEVAAGHAAATAPRLEQVAAAIGAALALQADVALACILHNQQGAPYAVRHSVDCALVVQLVARAFKLDEAQVRCATLGALTMNVGMFDHQERLQGSDAPLGAADTALIRAHPARGAALLAQAGVDDPGWLACVAQHHEHDDGSGYPHGLTAAHIGAPARIVALADRYCARISARSYRQPMLPNAALRDILLEGKTAADAQLAAVFIRELGIYPIGTFVRLLNGEIGVVTRKGLNSTTPIVDALVGPRGAPLDVAIRRDTQHPGHAIRDVLHASQADVGFRLEQLWGRVAAS